MYFIFDKYVHLHRFKTILIMVKYVIAFFGFPCVLVAQQAKETYYAVPYLHIENEQKTVKNGVADFGYNVLVHSNASFLKEGYYMWVDDQWYEIVNKEIFKPYKDFKTLFSISEQTLPLKIKDVNDVVYLYPVEALDSYKVSYNEFLTLSTAIKKEDAVTYIKPVEVPKVATKEAVAEAKPTDLPKLNPPAKEEVLITSENPQSVLLDVMDVVEVVKREEVPFNPNKNETVESKPEFVEIKVPEANTTDATQVKVSATNTPIIAKPANDYEIAVNEGFDGTVTEWIEMIDAKGGKTAYQQALDKGYKGTEEEWMKMLWGREVDVEIAKRDKTSAIVSEWIQSLKTSKGSSPYEMALKHGFYGTFTEWVESVIGTDGEKAYEHAQTKGFKGTYKEWIEEQLTASNNEILRKERLSKTQMFVAPNVILPLKTDATEPLTFNLYDYYNQYYGAPVISSDAQQVQDIDVKPTDLEYQITWFEKDKIKVIELTKEGVLKYQPLNEVIETTTKLNIRYILK